MGRHSKSVALLMGKGDNTFNGAANDHRKYRDQGLLHRSVFEGRGSEI